MIWLSYDNLPYVYAFLGGLAIALGLGLALVRIRPRKDRVETLLLFLAPAAVYLLLVKSMLGVTDLRQVDWASGRLSPAISLLYGFTLYYPQDSGPIYNTIYAPMAYLSYLPAGLFKGPTGALVAGAAISQILSLAPILLICFARRGDKGLGRNILLSMFVFLGFWGFTFHLHDVMAPLISIHADAPALGFGGLAFAILYARRREETLSNRTLLGSAFCGCLAVWAKQTAVPLLLVLPAWILLANGVRPFLRYVGWQVASMAVLSGAFVATFGFRELRFNLMEIPKSHPWMFPASYTGGFLSIGFEEIFSGLPIAYLLLLAIYFRGRKPRALEGEVAPGHAMFGRVREFLRANYWVMFLTAGLALAPLSLVSRIKFGGALNSYTPPLYYLLASFCAMILDWHARNEERGLRQSNRVLKLALLVSPLSPMFLLNHDLLSQLGQVKPLHQNYQEQAFQYARQHPGEAYFPCNPLSTLMADGQAYHFEFGVFDRDLDGRGPDGAHVLKNLPNKMRVIAYPPNRLLEYSMKNFHDYSKRVAIRELPGWICYERR